MTTSEIIGDRPRVPREPDADELRRSARAQFWKRIALAAIAAALVLMLGFSSWTLYLIRTGQVQNRPTLNSASTAANEAKKATARIEDCTTPGGTCYERGQRQTSGAVAGINTITVSATACLAVVLKGVPDGSQVNVDAIAQQIQQCIQATAVKQVTPPRATPTPKKPRPKPTGPRGPNPSTTSSSSPRPSPSPSAHPTSGTTSPTTPATPGAAITELTCALAPLLCP